jgi:hypothetical protein
MPALEAHIEAAWIAKQTAKGTPVAVAVKRGRKVGGGMSPNPEHGSEPYSDGERFNNAEDFLNTLVGNGNPIFQAQPGLFAYLHYLMLGAEVVTGPTNTVYQHVATPNNAGGFWFGAWKRAGQNVLLRQKFNDCRLVSLRVEGSSANKVVKITPTFISLDSGEIFTSDPVQAEDADRPFLYTEAVGTFNLDGTVFKGHSSFAYVISDAVTPWYGDDVTPYDVAFGRGQITVEGVTLLVDQAGLEQYNRIVYGSANPGNGVKPQKSVYYGSYAFELKRGTAGQADYRRALVEFPRVKWNPDVSIEGNPQGGAVELALGAEARKASGQPMIRVTSNVLDAAYT